MPIIKPYSRKPLTDAEKSNLLDRLEEIYEEIADRKGMNVDYCESMDGSLFPQVVKASLGDEDVDMDGLRFLAQNERFFPKRLAKASNDALVDYLRRHERTILAQVEQEAESDLEFA